MDTPTLFTPIRIGDLTLRNRIVMSPMETSYGTREGLPSQRTIDYLEARARGGVGLITLGASSIDPQHKEVPNGLHFGSDDVIGVHRELVERVHAHGAAVQPQLVHPGPDGLSPFLCGIPSLGPSVIPSYLTGVPCRELAVDEIPGIIEQYRAAARRVKAAGYDGIELHAAHGYMLLGSFLTPWRNHRSDEYAGSTSEGRTRLIREVVSAIVEEVGAELPLTLRISGYERVAGGRGIEDTQAIAPALVAAGVAAFHVSGGVIDRLTTQMVTGSHFPDAHNVGAATAVKRVVDVPIIAVGRIHDVGLAEEIVREGRADLVAMARPLLADPDLPRKAMSGERRTIRPCISCQNCIDSMETQRMSCAVNAFTGREGELAVPRAAVRKRVVVIGGGPAGMEVARLAAAAGHDVSLHEKRRRLGGALVFASVVHRDNERLLDHLLLEVERVGVAVHLGADMQVGDVAAMAPDAVVVAVGGRLVTPEIPGGDLPFVTSGALLRDLLSGQVQGAEGDRLPPWQRLAARVAGQRLAGAVSPRRLRALSRRWMPLGRRVAIVGGDLAAVELGEFLAERGRAVSILEAGPSLAPEVGLKRRSEHMDRLDKLGVSVNTSASVAAIEAGAVVLEGGRQFAVDSVVLAGVVESDTSFYDAIREQVPAAFAIGDCTGLGLIRQAIEDAARVASLL